MAKRFATLDSLKADAAKAGSGAGGGGHDDGSDDEKPPQNYYVGGASSGLAVEDPKGKGKPGTGGSKPVHPKDLVDRIMAKTGEGREEGSRDNIKLEFYKNGFIIDGGDLRRYDDPANAAFLADIDKGRMPRELEERSRGGEIGVDVTNKRGEDYVAPPYRAFSGAGAAIGGGSAAPASAVVAGALAAAPLDEAAPSTTVQVKLADGRRERLTLNLTHTVGDLQARVQALAGTARPFVLLAGFPPKPLSDPAAPMAGLKGAAITQKEQ